MVHFSLHLVVKSARKSDYILSASNKCADADNVKLAHPETHYINDTIRLLPTHTSGEAKNGTCYSRKWDNSSSK